MSVRKRAVFFIGGYDPKSPEAFFDRLLREAGRYEQLVEAELEAVAPARTSGHLTIQKFHTSGKDWTVDTDFHFVGLDDIVLKDFDQPLLVRLGRYGVTFADYVFSGSAFAFMKHAWRFSLYFFYPFLMMLLGLAVSLGLAWLIATSGVALAWLTAPVIFLAAISTFLQMVAPRYFVLHLMDLWSFSRDFIHRSRKDIDEKLESVANQVAKVCTSGAYDEVLLVGHSTGGALILDVAARAESQLEARDLGSTKPIVLTVGSTALKIGLHPAAGWFRDKVARLVDNPAWHWLEYQCRNDLINFFNTQPARLMGVGNAAKPIVGRIRIRYMLDAKTYSRIRRNFFRVHYQFVFGNNKAYHYDFPAFCFGPNSMVVRGEELAAWQVKLKKEKQK